MNYFKFVKGDSSHAPAAVDRAAAAPPPHSSNLSDPVVRRYYYWKYGLQSSMLGLAIFTTKALIENL